MFAPLAVFYLSYSVLFCKPMLVLLISCTKSFSSWSSAGFISLQSKSSRAENPLLALVSFAFMEGERIREFLVFPLGNEARYYF